MQSFSVYLVPNKIDVFTGMSAEWKSERYRRVYNRNLKIYRGVDNRIDLQVRNTDQKPANLLGRTLVFTLIEREQQKKLVEKDCSVLDDTYGRYFVSLSDTELSGIEPGLYEFTLKSESRQAIDSDYHRVTDERLLYVDSQYDAFGTIEIYGSVSGEVRASQTVREFSRSLDITNNIDFFTSGLIDARPEVGDPQSLHTFQLFFNVYEGDVTIQGSISDSGNPHVWSDIETFPVDVNDTVMYRNITGKYNWFRVRHTPNRGSTIAEFVVAQTLLLTYTVSIRSAGRGYNVGETITVRGNNLGGELTTNDLTITVTGIDSIGAITSVSWTGLSYNGVKTFVVSGEEPNRGSVDKILYR